MSKRIALTVLAVAALAALVLLRPRSEPAAAGVERAATAETIAIAPTVLAQRTTSERAATEQPMAAPPAPAAPYSPDLQRTPALRAAFERESPDATAHEAEARLRAIYEAERDADTILRAVRCTRSVCKLDLRWSPELNKPYNDALVQAIKAFGRDIDLTPDVTLGGPEMPIPMTLFIARPGHSVASLVAEQAAQHQP